MSSDTGIFCYFSPSDLKKFSKEECDRIVRAYDVCLESHRGQIRRSGEDFWIHPLTVAQILLKWGQDVNMIIAAILHDAVEDSTLTLEAIEKEFGEEVFLYVFALTKGAVKGDSFHKDLSMLEEEPNILIIKLADRLHNMRTIESMPGAKRDEKALETLSTYVPIARSLEMYDVAEELKEISEKYC